MRLAILALYGGFTLLSAQIPSWDSALPLHSPGSRQSSSGFPLSGTITGLSPQQLAHLRVELVELGSRIVRAESMVSSNGLFSLGVTPQAHCELRVVDLMGAQLYSQELSSGAIAPLTIRLGIPRPQPRDPVSLQRLTHKVPKQARKKMEAAEKLFRQQRSAEARQELAAAIALDPDYFEALSNLGALELVNNDPQNAALHLQRALELDPAASLVAANLSAALLLTGHHEAAEQAARQSLRHDSAFSRSRYLLALSLLRQNKNIPEALDQLGRAQTGFAPAGELLKQLAPSPSTP